MRPPNFKLWRILKLWLLPLYIFVLGQPAAAQAAPDSTLLFIGTYSGPRSKGIYLSRLDPQTGKLTAPELAAEAQSPSFLALHPNQRFLYAVGEIDTFEGKKAGAVSAFGLDANSGKLTLLNQQSSGGPGPCHLAVDRTGQCVLVANYGGGSIEALPIGADGRLSAPSTFIQHQGSSANRQRQAGPHAHFMTTDPANRLALVCDLGLDKVLLYRLNPAQGTLTPSEPPSASVEPGAGPRHLAFHPNGRFLYVINEMKSTITAFAFDAQRGTMTEIHTVSTLPETFSGNSSCAEIAVHSSGKFVYGSNRGHDSIVVFAVDSGSGKLSLVEHQSTQGKTPRHFAIDPGGKWLLAENQNSDSIVVFGIDAKSGRLKATGNRIEVGSPVCVQFVPGN
jgi:6-phosphogluconolactonase